MNPLRSLRKTRKGQRTIDHWVTTRGLASVLICVGSTIAVAADWPHFLGPTHDGVSAETGLLETWPKDGPPIAWEMQTGETFAAPSIVGGKLILFHRVKDEEVVECLEATSGRKVWRFAYPTQYVDRYGYNGGPRAAPTIAEGRVYTYGAEGTLHALDFETGKALWDRDIKKEFKVPDNFFGVGSAPVLEGDRLLIAAGGADGAGLLALAPSTGKLLWKASNQGASYATPYAATIRGKRRIVHFGKEGVVCVEAETGAVNWTYPFRSRTYESVNAAGPVVSGNLVFASASYRTGAVLLRVSEDGSGVDEVWKNGVIGNHWATSIIEGKYIYGFHGRHESEAVLKCIEFETGREMWARAGLGRGSMIRADGRTIILGERGRLVLAELTSTEPKILWFKPYLRHPCWTAPVLTDGLLYIRNQTRLICLDIRSKDGNSEP